MATGPPAEPPRSSATSSASAGSEVIGQAPVPFLRTPLIGRAHEVATIHALLQRDDVPLVTLTGPGGVGKTRLALHVASQASPGFADGVCFIEFAAVRDPELVLSTIARTLGINDEGTRSLLEQLAAYLQTRRLLLILDNLEHVLEAAAVIPHLLTRCPHLKVLATSRVVLRVSDEYIYPVDPLAVPESVQLFVARARAARSDFRLSAENAATVAKICTRLDGLPLAIELAAARSTVLPPSALLNRLEQAERARLPILTGGARDRPDRLRTMRNAIAWSYDLLDAAEQSLLCRLSVFVGGFSLDAAEAVCGPQGTGKREQGTDDEGSSVPRSLFPLPSVLDGVSSLIEASLVRRGAVSEGEEPRYLMLETIREFGLEQLDGRGETELVRRAHVGYFADFATRAEPELTGPDQLVWFERLETEHPNLRSAGTSRSASRGWPRRPARRGSSSRRCGSSAHSRR